MGIFSIFKRSSLPRIEHRVFGQMEATLVNEDGSYFWETPEPFPTAKGPISVFFDGSGEGPSAEQISLWQWIYDNSERFSQLAKPLLLDRLNDFGLEARIDDLIWTGVGLSPDGEKDGPWDMSFELPGDHSPILTAYFKEGIPTTVSFDD